ncbi:TfuA-like protein [Pelagibius litoralis]|nr:TfuA-like protein [Pelagibius litoralis]
MPRQDAEALLSADFHPPVRQGDVYRIVREKRPSAIAIIDGYFQEVPSVWHKEILWALDQGIAVFGAASMGALRAAELERFGMRGVGRVFEAFRDGIYPPYANDVFEDDDEVAVIHGPPELGFPALSDAMVDLRSTFARAAEEGVIDEAFRDRLVSAFKQRFYRERSVADLPDVLAGLDAPSSLCEALQAWLPGGRVEQKRDDAKALLGILAREKPTDDNKADDNKAKDCVFVFERTTLWAQFIEASHDRSSGYGAAAGKVTAAENRVLDELRLNPPLFAELRPLAALRYACLSGKAMDAPGDVERRAALNRLRRRMGLWSRDALETWARVNDLDRAGLDRLIETEALIEQQATSAASGLDAFLLDILRSESRYEALARRAVSKAESEADDESRGIDSLTPAFLVDWFFEEHLGKAAPHDPRAVSEELGFATFDSFVEALAREYRYARRLSAGDAEP